MKNNAAAAQARAKGEFMSIKNTDGRPFPGRRVVGVCSFFFLMACSVGLAVLQGCQGAPTTETHVASTTDELHSNAQGLRDYIAQQVGGLDKLTVPPNDEAIPLPPDDPARPGRYKTTEAKRYLGKLLFHDPVRTARLNISTGVPVDLPEGTAFGGTVKASEPNIQGIVDATRQTGSCGSCHIGEAAAKAGERINFSVGGEGRGYTDEDRNFFPRRRARSILTKVRAAPIFAGDALVDALPTLSDVVSVDGQRDVTTPARYHHEPLPDALLETGRLDELDSVARQSPSLIGFAFNNRLLLGGLGGEPQPTPGSLNPFNDPAGENITLLLLDAHRMLDFQSAELLKIPAFVKLFQDAFPDEAAQAEAKNDKTILVNDQTEFRAQATFLRTVVTRNTPFDRFLAGQDHALTASQRRGAQLFFTKAEAGGAGCFNCHSGPILNKQANDPDVAGIGQFVEENFINVGIGDHPLQALNAAARGRLDPNKLGEDGFPYHAEDTGRQETTHNPDDAFKFRSLTLRQLKDARTFFHNGSFTKVREVVSYFNAGIPQDAVAGAAPTLDRRFTNPRGENAPLGLGLNEQQIDEIADFLENGLYDPSFAQSFQPNEEDLAYSKNRPDLAALGAKDGQLLSGRAIDDDDPLSRRDQGLEFLDVSAQLHIALVRSHRIGHRQRDIYQITNNSSSIVDTHLLMIAKALPDGIEMKNASGITSAGEPYRRVFLANGVLLPGQSIVKALLFEREHQAPPVKYTLNLLSGQGNP